MRMLLTKYPDAIRELHRSWAKACARVVLYFLMSAWVVQALPMAWGQVGINADGVSPDAAALLDVNADGLPASDKKGLLMPSMALNTSLWSYAPAAAPSNPFSTHGVAAMVPSLWLYNNTGFTPPSGVNFQYATTTGLYWWDTAGDRWLRQQAKVLPTQYHVTTGSITVSSGSWSTIPGLETVALQLKAGDRVLFSADGAFTLPPPTPPSQSSEYAHASARVQVSGAANSTLKQTATSVVNESQLIQSSFCGFWIFCGGTSYMYTTKLGLQNWRLIGAYDVPADGTYTFAVQMARLSGLAGVIGGGTLTTNSELRGTFSVEVIRP